MSSVLSQTICFHFRYLHYQVRNYHAYSHFTRVLSWSVHLNHCISRCVLYAVIVVPLHAWWCVLTSVRCCCCVSVVYVCFLCAVDTFLTQALNVTHFSTHPKSSVRCVSLHQWGTLTHRNLKFKDIPLLGCWVVK